MVSDSDTVLLRLIAAFEALGIEYRVGGSVASSMLGIPRLTQNVDIVAAIREPDTALLIAELNSDFYVDADLIHAALQATRENASFNVIFLPLMLKADIFVRQSTPWQDAAWQRRVQRPIRMEGGEKSVYLASPDDMILQKLHLYP